MHVSRFRETVRRHVLPHIKTTCLYSHFAFIVPNTIAILIRFRPCAFAGDRRERNPGVPKVWVQTVAGAVPGMRARDVQVGRVLEMRHRADVHQPTPPVGHVQDGAGLGPGRGGRPSAEGARHQGPPGGRHVHHACHTGGAHQLDGVHDRREGVRHDQGELAQTVTRPTATRACGAADLHGPAYRPYGGSVWIARRRA